MHKFLVHPNPSSTLFSFHQYNFTGGNISPRWSGSWGKAKGPAGIMGAPDLARLAVDAVPQLLGIQCSQNSHVYENLLSIGANSALFDRAKLHSSFKQVGTLGGHGGGKKRMMPGGRKNS